MSAVSGIQGHLLEVTVVGCNKLKDTEWISRQDPYVCLEYANTKFRTRTCTDGGKHPTFQEKFVFSLIEGLREINVVVWNSNTLTFDDFIGSGKVQLQKVLSQGFDDSPWTLQSKRGKYAGEVKLIMHYPNAQKPGKGHVPSAAPYGAAPYGYASAYAPPAPAPASYPPIGGYPTASSPYPSSAYPPPIDPAPYPYSPYPPPPPSAAYPSQGYPPTAPYPAQAYPPPQQTYPYHHPPGSYPGAYPPPY